MYDYVMPRRPYATREKKKDRRDSKHEMDKRRGETFEDLKGSGSEGDGLKCVGEQKLGENVTNVTLVLQTLK